MDHTDNLEQLELDITNLENATAGNIAVLESNIDEIDTRSSNLEQFHFGKCLSFNYNIYRVRRIGQCHKEIPFEMCFGQLIRD